MIYLDSAATSLHKPKEVKTAVLGAMDTMSSPGRGGHGYAMRAAETVFCAREAAARLFNAGEPERVVFTFNATHALNIAINSILKPGDRALISGWEHNSVLRPLHALGAEIEVAEAGFDRQATIEAFRKGLEKRPAACVVNHVSNVTGFILPVYDIAAACREEKIPLIIDASQSAGSVKVDFEALGADFVAMAGHKGLYGPQGTGILLVKGGSRPLLFGGSGSSSALPDMPEFLPDRLEAGTHNTAGIAGLCEGIKFVRGKGEDKILSYERGLINYAVSGLRGLGGVTVYAPRPQDRAGVLSFNLTGLGPEEGGEAFNKRGIALRAGLHCAPIAHKTLGTFPEGTVRLSVSAFTTRREIDAFLNAAEDIKRKRG